MAANIFTRCADGLTHINDIFLSGYGPRTVWRMSPPNHVQDMPKNKSKLSVKCLLVEPTPPWKKTSNAQLVLVVIRMQCVRSIGLLDSVGFFKIWRVRFEFIFLPFSRRASKFKIPFDPYIRIRHKHAISADRNFVSLGSLTEIFVFDSVFNRILPLCWYSCVLYTYKIVEENYEKGLTEHTLPEPLNLFFYYR